MESLQLEKRVPPRSIYLMKKGGKFLVIDEVGERGGSERK
jgi:hypothetical protein